MRLAGASALRARDVWQAVRADIGVRLRMLLPALAEGAGPDPADEPDPVRSIMSEFEELGQEQKDKVARNLALLWSSFIDAFGGVSAFQSASTTDRQAYVDRLGAAARRMEAAKGTEAAFHYVTVELLRQYVFFLQIGSTDQGAVALAQLVAPLIDRGHAMSPEPTVYLVGRR